MERRRFLGIAAAGAGVLAMRPGAGAGTAARRLAAVRSRQLLAGNANPATDVWSYDGAVPGSELRYRQGERLRIEVENRLDVETTVHWHGIRLPNAMDGVPHLTQPPIARRGGRFLYEFDLPDAGTYWYHPHLGSPEQVGRGLYGALVVEEREPPPVDRDLVWVLSDWRLDEQARIVEDFGHSMDASHAGRIGTSVTLNGREQESFAVRAGERLRLRLVNASSARIYGLSFEGHAPWLVAFDGQPVEPHALPGARLVLGPAQRADLILDCSAEPGSVHRVIDDFYRRRAYEFLQIAYAQAEPLRRSFAPVPQLPENPFAKPQPDRAERHRIVFGGGAMGAVPNQREHRGVFWTVNGRAVPEHHPSHAPLLALRRGETYVLELVNETAWHHPIHLHGHVFRVLTRDGREALPRLSGDTILLDPRSRAEVAFVADNPGDWMLHCHVLEHQASGMMATLRVA